jgi:hypothetical protein
MPLKHMLLKAKRSILKFSHLFFPNEVMGILACNGFATISFAPSWKIILRLMFYASVNAISM